MQFSDRDEAARQLAIALAHHRGHDVVVLGVPRGGVPVASQVALWLDAPLDVVVVRKVPVPGHRDLAVGAIGENGVMVTNHDILTEARVSVRALEDGAARERKTVRRRTGRLRGPSQPVPLSGRVAIVVDDGVATGATARAACLVARERGAARVVLATPVAAAEALPLLDQVADEVVSLSVPESFWTIGDSYRYFVSVSDAEVHSLLA